MSALANQEAARALADRYRPLAEIEAVSKQDYTNALGASRQADAAVSQRRAQLEDGAKINLRYTSVPAPISGRIGRSLITDGGLATANQATPLAQINQLDPIYVDIQQSAAQLLAIRRGPRWRRRRQHGREAAARGRQRLWPPPAASSSPRRSSTKAPATVTLRAEFPNPDGLLLPGMFVRARLAQTVDKGVFLVPQVGVQRSAQVWIAGPGDKAELRPITAARTQGPRTGS